MKMNLIILLLSLLSCSILSPLLANPNFIVDFNFPAVFNFGDSNSDTGQISAGLGVHLSLPYGCTYFHKSSSRMCDGRLVIDFLMDAMGLPFLNPYLNAIGAPSFRNGCNFAALGCTILPATTQSDCPFSFGIQVSQFLQFKAEVLRLQSETKELHKYPPPEDYFNKGLYMFDISQNDLRVDYDFMPLDQVLAFIQTILAEFEAGIKKLYEEGARNIWVHNTGPYGCLAQIIAKYGIDPSKLDEHGCLSSHNQAAKIFNLQLHELCRKLQSQYSEANITYTDIFAIKFDLIVNCSRYGFKQPIMACCGYGGPPLNCDIMCSQTKVLNGRSVTAKAWDDSAEYVSWDGVHLTEAANRYISPQILSGRNFLIHPSQARCLPFSTSSFENQYKENEKGANNYQEGFMNKTAKNYHTLESERRRKQLPEKFCDYSGIRNLLSSTTLSKAWLPTMIALSF